MMALYDYGNTRLRAQTSRMFSPQTLDSFADLNSLDRLISHLSKSHYKNSIEISLTYAHGYGCITHALHRELLEIRQVLERFYDQRLWEKIRTIFMRVDLQNIKTIFRGILHKSNIDMIIRSLSPLGTLPEYILTAISKSENIQDAIDKMIVFELDFANELLRLKSSSDPIYSSEIERILEIWFFKHIETILRGGDKNLKLLRQLNNKEVDTVNINTLLRFIDAPNSPELEKNPIEYFLVNGGEIERQLFLDLSKETSVKIAITQIALHNYHDELVEALVRYEQNGLLSEFEKSLRIHTNRWLSKLTKLNPFGIGVPMGYIALRKNEIRNIRWIADGIYSGFEKDYIKDNIEIIK